MGLWLVVERLFTDHEMDGWSKENMLKLLSLKFTKFYIEKEKYTIFID